MYPIDHFPYIVDFRSAEELQWSYHTITGRLHIPTRASRQIFWVARVFFRMAPSVDGERARQLANSLLGTKDGGRHHQERASALTR